MKFRLFLFLIIFLFIGQANNAQVFYVDSKNGSDVNTGDLRTPFKTIQKAIDIANKLTGKGAITIKIMPGMYPLYDKIDISPVRILNENGKLIIESAILPGDTLWDPLKMPIILSFSENNSDTQFLHSTGFLVNSNFVEFRGIKFYGNTNPSVNYYYPITRESPALNSLTVSQCLFIGDKNTGVIQGGVWAHGTEINISNNIFYGCRNAILLFNNINNSIITNNIIYGAYESALWMGNDKNLKFENNIISNCNYFWIGDPNCEIEFTLSKSIISENNKYRGCWGNTGITESNQIFIEKKINKSDKIALIEIIDESVPYRYLHTQIETAGNDLNAGIFK